jgi:hypothetical protein
MFVAMEKNQNKNDQHWNFNSILYYDGNALLKYIQDHWCIYTVRSYYFATSMLL